MSSSRTLHGTAFTARIAAALVGMVGVCSASAQLSHVPLASTGNDVAGGLRGMRLNSIADVPVMSDGGKMVFVAGLAGMGVTPISSSVVMRMGVDQAVRSAMLTRTGVRGSGLPSGLVATAVGQPAINAAGASVYVATVSGPGVTELNNKVLMISDAASTRVIARKGSPAAGMGAGITIGDISSPAIAASGHVAFEAAFAGTGVQAGAAKGVYVMPPGGTPALALRQGGQVAGMDAGIVWYDFASPMLGTGGQLLMLGFMQGGDVTAANHAVLWSAGRGVIARRGDAVGDTGMTMGDFSEPSMSGSTVGFIAMLEQAGSTETRSGVFLSAGPGPAELVASTGAVDASMDTGTSWMLFGQPAMAARGGIAFLATITGIGVVPGSSDTGLWAGNASGITQIARTGDAIPAAPGVLFDSIGQPSISASGHVVFSAHLRGTGVTSANDSAIFSYHAGSGLITVARTGSPVMLSGVARTPTALQTAIGGENRPTCLTRSGALVYLLRDARGATLVRTILPTSLTDLAGASGNGSDGVVDRNDLAVFLAAFAAGSPLADVAGVTGPQRDGVVTQEDMDAFMGAYNARQFAGVR